MSKPESNQSTQPGQDKKSVTDKADDLRKEQGQVDESGAPSGGIVEKKEPKSK